MPPSPALSTTTNVSVATKKKKTVRYVQSRYLAAGAPVTATSERTTATIPLKPPVKKPLPKSATISATAKAPSRPLQASTTAKVNSAPIFKVSAPIPKVASKSATLPKSKTLPIATVPPRALPGVSPTVPQRALPASTLDARLLQWEYLVQESEKELSSIKISYETELMEASEKVLDLENEVESLGFESSQDSQLLTNIRQLEEMTSVLEDLNTHLSQDFLARYEAVADSIAYSVHSIAIDDHLTVSSAGGLKNALQSSSQMIQSTISRPMKDVEAVSRNIQLLASSRPDLVQEAHTLLHETTRQTIQNTSYVCSK